MPARAPGGAAKLKRLSSRGSQLQLKLLEKSTAGSDVVFGKYALLASRHPWKLFALGHIVAITFILGLLLAEKSTDINDLWIDTDSRVMDEKRNFEQKFGGVGRDLAVALQARGAGGVGTATALAAHQSTVEDLFTTFVTDRGFNFTQGDFCEKPPVPTIFQPGQPTARGYAMLSQCLANSPIFVNLTWPAFLHNLGQSIAKFEPLPSSWGIKNFPCNRGSPLDCFREGGEVNYPPGMKALERVAPAIGFAKATQLSSLIEQYASTGAVNQTLSALPCWLTSLPPSSSCILPSADITTKTAVFQGQAMALLSQGGGALPSSLQADEQAIAASLQALRHNTTAADLDSVVIDVQSFVRRLNKNLDGYLQLEMLRKSQAEVARCTWASVAGVFQLDVPSLNGLVQLSRIDPGQVTSEQQQVVNLSGQLNETIFSLIDAFASFGYWWRPSYKNMSPQQILAVYRSANESESNANVTLEQCITGQSQGRYCCLTWDGTKSGMQFFLGNVGKFLNGTYKWVNAYQTGMTNYDTNSRLWREMLQEKVNETYTSEQQLKLAERFEEEVMKAKWFPKYKQQQRTGFAPGENYQDYKITFVTERSLSDLLDEGTDVETRPLVISYVVMTAFICLTLGKLPLSRNCQELINSHMLLGLYGLLTVALSTAAGLGFSAYAQLKFTPITSNLAPFVSLGLGVDDMFVLVHSMIHQFRPGDSLEMHMIRCMHLAGPSVFLTSVANAVAFFIMSSTPTKAIYLFGISAGINVLFNFILLHLIFVPAIFLDTKRMVANRLDVFLVKVTPTPNVEPAKKDDEAEKGGGRAFLKRLRGNDDQPISEYVATVIGEKLKNPIVKACVIFLSIAFTAVMIWSGVDRTTEGLDTSDIALKNTYQHDMALLVEHNFPVANAYLMATSANFSNTDTQQTYLDCLDSISTSPWIMAGLPPKAVAWFADSQTSFLGTYASQAKSPSLTSNTPVPTSQFRSARLGWLSQLGITQLPNLRCVDINNREKWVDCTDPSSYLESAKAGVYFDNLRTIEDYRDVLRNSRKLVDPYKKNGLNVYMIGNMYYFFEQYLHMSDNALRTTGFTLLGVFFITFIFQFSPMLSTLVCVTVASVVVELWGMFTYIDAKLNPFSVANLAISVGMAVEFTAHVARSFAIAKGSHDQRMVTALKEMMVPMYQGAASTIVAMAALADAQSPFFRVYYCYTFIVMIAIAMVNGLIVLPVLLSLVGPAEFGAGKEFAENLKEEDMMAIAEDAEEKIELSEPEWRARQ